PGFPVDGLLTMRVTRSEPESVSNEVAEAHNARYFTDAAERLRRLPGVTAAGALSRLPFHDTPLYWDFEIEDFPTPPGHAKPNHEFRTATPGGLEALGVPLLRGRFISADDRLDTQLIVVINQALARRYWHDADPVGRRIQLDDGKQRWATIIGVVGDVHEFGLDAEVQPTMYYAV